MEAPPEAKSGRGVAVAAVCNRRVDARALFLAPVHSPSGLAGSMAAVDFDMAEAMAGL